MSWMRMPACRYAMNANGPLVHAMMRMPFIGMQWMWMPAWVCNECQCPFRNAMNANARLGMQWMQMSPWEYAMMRMSAWEYAMVWMSSCRYTMNANAPLWVYHDTECFGANTIYSNIPFIFKTRLPQRLKPKYFQTQFIIHEKSSSFWLKAPQKIGDHC